MSMRTSSNQFKPVFFLFQTRWLAVVLLDGGLEPGANVTKLFVFVTLLIENIRLGFKDLFTCGQYYKLFRA